MLPKVTPKTAIGEEKGLLRIRLYSCDANGERDLSGERDAIAPPYAERGTGNAIANKQGDLRLQQKRTRSPLEYTKKTASKKLEQRSLTKLLLHWDSNPGVGATISKCTSALLLLTLLKSSLCLASTRVETIEQLILQSTKAMLSQLPLVADDANTSQFLQVSSQTNQLNPSIFVGEAHRGQLPPIADDANLLGRAEFLSQASPQVIPQGTQISLNGRMFQVAWKQWQLGTSLRTGISDVGLMQTLGMELLSTKDFTRQPVQWFSYPPSTPLVLASRLSGSYRYLDITDFARIAGWQLQVRGDTLQIYSVPARVENIRLETQPSGSRIIIDLDRPTPWQVRDQRTEGAIALEGIADPSLIDRFSAPPVVEQRQEVEDTAPVPIVPQSPQPAIRVENAQNQTLLRVSIPEGKRLQVYSVPNPYRLVIDLRPDSLVEKEIVWAPGIRWRQQYVNLGESRFPVVWLEVDPRTSGVSFRPIWSNPATQVGTAPLIQTAQLWQASAAINAGFFNRKQQLPLGAIRRDGRWLSGPILNRGAIAWDNTGRFKFGRLSLQETLIATAGVRLPVLFLNSGYVQSGIARYTSEWGPTYTPLTDNEVLVFVQNNQVTAQMPGGTTGQMSFPIPSNGYLLTFRANSTTDAYFLSVGTQVRIDPGTTPAEFDRYPHILGAGPLLLQNRQIVLDAKGEQFSNSFIQQSAIRSCIGITAAGTLIITAIHGRVGGRGPSLTETAQLMQQLGAIDALNLDGGSSTGLYLGGQLLDRSPSTAARVHNGIGIFRPPLP